MSTELIARLPLDQLGGGRVFRPCEMFGHQYKVGDVIPPEIIRKVPRQNLKAMIDQRFLTVWPVSETPPSAPATDEEVFVYAKSGTSRFDVVVGHKLNAVPLSKAEAEKLADANRKPAAA